eukprot:3507160-Amphidinium_carterae.1
MVFFVAAVCARLQAAVVAAWQCYVLLLVLQADAKLHDSQNSELQLFHFDSRFLHTRISVPGEARILEDASCSTTLQSLTYWAFAGLFLVMK